MAQTSPPLHHSLRERSPSPSLRDREDLMSTYDPKVGGQFWLGYQIALNRAQIGR